MERLRKRRKTVSQALSSGRPRLAQGAARARPEGRAEPGSRGTGSRGHPPAPAPLRPGRSRGPRGTGVLQRDVASSPAPAGDQERLLEPRRRPPRRAALRDGPAREREPGAAVCRPSSPAGSRPFTVKGARVRRAGVRPTAGRRGRRRALPPGSTDPVITGPHRCTVQRRPVLHIRSRGADPVSRSRAASPSWGRGDVLYPCPASPSAGARRSPHAAAAVCLRVRFPSWPRSAGRTPDPLCQVPSGLRGNGFLIL